MNWPTLFESLQLNYFGDAEVPPLVLKDKVSKITNFLKICFKNVYSDMRVCQSFSGALYAYPDPTCYQKPAF